MNRLLSKLAYDDKVQGVYGAQNHNVLDIHEDLNIRVTQQFISEVEFRKRSSVMGTEPQ
ncbi:hypothetical protein MIDIC_240050 [Alphaproteobacteria bacterium]